MLDTRGISEGQLKKFKWKGASVQIPEINQQYPIDLQQVPDIFIHLYTSTFTGPKRIGYVRVSPKDSSVVNNSASWFAIKDPSNNFDGRSPGILLANIRLLQGESTKMARPAIRYDNEAVINFYAFVYSAVELSPESSNDSVRARLEFSFCDLRPDRSKFEVEKSQRKNNEPSSQTKNIEDQGQDKKASKLDEQRKAGVSDRKPKTHSMIIESDHLTKNPIFGSSQKGEFIMASAKVTGGIEMAPSIMVTVFNANKASIFDKNDFKVIGTCYISPSQCKLVKANSKDLEKIKPQYYNVLGADGSIQGKIMMLIGLSKNLKDSISEEEFRRVFDIGTRNYKLDFSCIGIRNLNYDCPCPVVTLRIPSYQLMIQFKPAKDQGEYLAQEEEKERIRKNRFKPEKKRKGEQEKKKDSVKDREREVVLGDSQLYMLDAGHEANYISSLKQRNPNICATSCIECLALPKDCWFWPRAEIEVSTRDRFVLTSEYFTTVNLVDCIEGYHKYSDLISEKLGIKKTALGNGVVGDDQEETEETNKGRFSQAVRQGHSDRKRAHRYV